MSKPVLSDPIALRLPEDMLRDIETIAKATERTRSWVIVRALKYYLRQEGSDILEIVEGEKQIRNDEIVEADDLFALLLADAKDNAA
ncbi:CopG family ribbon-helix-helix protein [Rhizobium sp. Rhizsp82]|uniref:CopG family ribbon-helix-helix protein n=1 Tax=Rhizobium sp. Rhizsp82 TaxID=3243057 RepID=UPI0039B42D49